MEEINFYINETEDSMAKAISHLDSELSKVRAGKASPQMFEGLKVEYYGADTPINQVASISNQDSKTLIIKPWEKSMLEPIDKAISAANLGVTPQNDGEIIRIIVPPVTEERRMELVKKVKALGEQAKISIRNIRRDTNDGLKDLKKEGAAEDLIKDAETKVQQITDKYVETIDEHVKAKEQEILTI